jgi:uncharacterized protein YcnI
MKKKIVAIFTSIVGMIAISVIPAFAHVIVSPDKVGVSAIHDFSVSVPNEKDNPVISVRLIIPDGLSSVVPNTVAGWTISTKSNGSGDNATVTEIDWTGGSIPVGQRAEFVIQAQAPTKPTTLNWKAYQTYSNGTVVSWDVNPDTMKNLSDAQQDEMANKENKGEYSTTQVVNDLTGSANMSMKSAGGVNSNSGSHMKWLMALSIGALALSIVAISMQMRKKR